MPTDPDGAAVRAAAARIAGLVRRTPVLHDEAIDARVGTPVHCKCEHLQLGGAFKLRGALNAVLARGDKTHPGVAAHSSGNHAAALARAAAIVGVPCHVVIPEHAPRVKVEAAAALGATVVPCGPGLADRQAALDDVLARTGAIEIHPYDDPDVIAGQGTATLELLDEVPTIRTVVAPVSGGGLLSGTALAAHSIDPTIRIVGAEPVNVDDAYRSLTSGTLVGETGGTTIADGLLATLSPRTFRILTAEHVEIVTVDETEIVDAMQILMRDLRQVVEPSGAVALAGVIAAARRSAPAGPVGVILSGGNVNLDRLPSSNRSS